MLDKRCRNLTEKCLNLEFDYQTVKSKSLHERSNIGVSDHFEHYYQKPTRKIEINNECKHIVMNLTNKLNSLQEENSKLQDLLKISEQPSQSLLENQISLLEEEINLLKTENRILISKEKELNARLKSAENARSHYHEKAIILKDKVSSLELQIIYQDSSSIDLRLHDTANPSDKIRMSRNRTPKDIKEHICDKSLPLTNLNTSNL